MKEAGSKGLSTITKFISLFLLEFFPIALKVKI